MIEASIPQILRVWAELEDARHGINGFGSSTAEVYAHVLLPYSGLAAVVNPPRGSLPAKEQDDRARRASRTLEQILNKFLELRPKAMIVVDGKPYRLGRTKLPPCYHRWHIEVTDVGPKMRRRGR